MLSYLWVINILAKKDFLKLVFNTGHFISSALFYFCKAKLKIMRLLRSQTFIKHRTKKVLPIILYL